MSAPAAQEPSTQEPDSPQSPVPAATRAYRSTKDRIIRGELPGGTAISEVTVCKELGLSRTPVHEAFLRLAAEDLLTLESRKGAVVRPMRPNEANDVLQMREAIEAAAARRAIETGRAAEAAPRLDASLRDQAAALGGTPDGTVDGAPGATPGATADGDGAPGTPGAAARPEPPAPDAIAAFVTADDAFHSAVVAASHNPIAEHFTALLRDRQQRLRHQLMRVRPDQLRPALAQHRRLAAALAAGDADEYARVLAEHVAMHEGVL